ncbi:MAG TPA: inositol monophosphatase family protein [Polyangiales bacterium]|jgi:myo-inositol-1(or 4)-monophosphatase|nr:inositol monophosphatase family protein [Polyangiales bacterium]
MAIPDRVTLSEIALDVAREAAALALAGWRSRPEVEHKGSYADLVTKFDLESERLIRARLAERTPEMAIVGEEQGGSANDAPTWFCDPIDGTVNFTHGHPFFAVSIGVLERGVPIAGAVVAPAIGTMWQGAVGHGAFRNGQPCFVSQQSKLDDSLLASGFSPTMRRAGHPEDNLAAFTRVMPAVRDIRRCGSAALDLCLVADGTYEAYWERKLSPWDTAAGTALVLAAGGTVTSLQGGPVDLARGYLIASNGRVHAALVEMLRD